MAYKARLVIEVDLKDTCFDPDSIEWFKSEILMNTTDDGCLLLHSNELGDTLGKVKVIEIQSIDTGADA